MAKKLFVGNLSYSATEEMLKNLFAEAGEVASATVISDKMTGRPRGFAFVEMATDEEAEKAIKMFDGKDFEGRAIIVNAARPMESRPKREGSDRFRGGHKNSW